MRKKRERERKERGIMTKMKERFCGRITKYVNLLFNSLIKAVWCFALASNTNALLT